MRFALLMLILLAFAHQSQAADPESATTTNRCRYVTQAAEVTDYIQQTFLDPDTGVYLKAKSNPRPDWVWLQSVMFANLIAASRADHDRYEPLLEHPKAWDCDVGLCERRPSVRRVLHVCSLRRFL